MGDRLARVGGLQAAVMWAVVAACSSSTTSSPGPGETSGGDAGGPAGDAGGLTSVYDSAPPPDSSLGVLGFQANPASYYSGFDGTHTFMVPISVHDGASDLTVTASDPAAVTITPAALANPAGDNGKYFMLTTLRAGTVTLTATSQGRSATATLTTTSYAGDRYAAGETRYMNAGSTGDPPCAQCHVMGQAIDHSPTILGPDDDQVVSAIITTGLLNNFPIQGVQGGHRWTVSATELSGLITYLRALPPRGFE